MVREAARRKKREVRKDKSGMIEKERKINGRKGEGGEREEGGAKVKQKRNRGRENKGRSY